MTGIVYIITVLCFIFDRVAAEIFFNIIHL